MSRNHFKPDDPVQTYYRLAAVLLLLVLAGAIGHALNPAQQPKPPQHFKLPYTDQPRGFESIRQASTSDSFDTERYCMAVAIFGEARSEPAEGQAAVAHVIRNRVTMGRWGSTVCAVTQARRQFAGVHAWNGKTPWMAEPDAWEQAWQIAGGKDAPACVHTATHFDSVRFKTPSWAKHMTYLCQVGLHRFYKEKRNV